MYERLIMLNWITKTLLVLSLTLPVALAANEKLTCGDGKWRKQVAVGKFEEEKIQLCHDGGGVHFTSPDCAEDTKKCLPKPREKKDELRLKTEVGSPGFKACDKYTGSAVFVDVWFKEKWHQTALCLFNKGKTFVDTNEMIKISRGP
jgi:hypothetical protein